MKRSTRIVQAIAVLLLLLYGSISTLADLFHTHHDLTQRDDCPACIWQQMSQEPLPDDGLTTQVEPICMVVALLQAPLEERVAAGCDLTDGIQPRAPPILLLLSV